MRRSGLDIIAVADAVIAEDVGVVPDFVGYFCCAHRASHRCGAMFGATLLSPVKVSLKDLYDTLNDKSTI